MFKEYLQEFKEVFEEKAVEVEATSLEGDVLQSKLIDDEINKIQIAMAGMFAIMILKKKQHEMARWRVRAQRLGYYICNSCMCMY